MNFSHYCAFFLLLNLTSCSPEVDNTDAKKTSKIVEIKPETPSLLEITTINFDHNVLSISEFCTIHLIGTDNKTCEGVEIIYSTLDVSVSEEVNFKFNLVDDSLVLLKLRGKKDKTPYYNDERNWGNSESFWIVGMEISVKNEELIMPVSAFADLVFPDKIQFGKSLKTTQEGFFIRFLTDQKQSSSQFNFVSYQCPDSETQYMSYSLESRIKWAPSMAGDSYQKTIYEFPNCN